MSTLMQAAVRTKSKLRVQNVAVPMPGDRDLLVRVHAATVTAGDLFLHKLPRLAFVPLSLMGIKWKSTPGHEFAGTVEAVGKDVTRFAVGDAVLGTTTGLSAGANAEYVCVPETSKSGVIEKKPEQLSFAEAAALPVGGMTALHFLQEAGVGAQQRVLVYGASGSVGSFAVQVARAFGAEVTAVSSARNADLVKSLGAARVIDYHNEDFTENGESYDVIFDAVGKLSGDQRKRAQKQTRHFVTVASMTRELAQGFKRVIEMAEAGQIKPIIDRRFSLDEVAAAYDYVNSGRKKGNVVIKVV